MAFRSSVEITAPAHPLVITPPAGLTDDDILVLWVVNDSSSSISFTPPSGFVAVTGLPMLVTADGGSLYVATKKAAGESGNYSISNSNSSTMSGGIAAFSGRDATNYLHRTSVGGPNNSANASPWTLTSSAFSSVTTDACDSIFIGINDTTTDSGGVSVSGPAGHTVREETQSGFHSSFMSSQDGVASGATGALSAEVTKLGVSSGWACVAIALLVSGGSTGGGGAPPYTGPYRRQTAFGLM